MSDADQGTPRRSPEPAAADYLPIVYEELRGIAASYLSNERSDLTLQPTALVHDAYLRLAQSDAWKWNDEGHFRAACAIAMRRILTDEARKRRAVKRGGDRQHLTLSGYDLAIAPPIDIVDLDDALEVLEERSPRHARTIELRFFGGLSVEQTAERLGVSVSTVESDWRTARAWLLARLGSAAS